MEHVSILPLVYIFNNLHRYSLTDTQFILWLVIQHPLMHCIVQIVPAFVSRNSFSWLLCHSDLPPSLWWILKALYYCVELQDYLVHFLPSHTVSHFSTESMFPLLENMIRNPHLGFRCASGYLDVLAPKLSVNRTRRHMCAY